MNRCGSVLILAIFFLLLPNVSGNQNREVVQDDPMQGIDPAPSHTRSDVPTGLYGGIVRYDDVALIVNDNSPISLEIGTYFAQKRGIPQERIINLSVPARETINAGEFDELARQVKENLSDRGLTDDINYLVTTKGVPLRVSGSQMRMASVDSELMLLDGKYEGNIHGNYWMTNPYFDKFDTFSREKYGIRLVTRLTGYTKEEAMNLIDLADASLGQRGRALLDMDPGKDGSSGYKIANDWMRNAHTWLTNNGYESLLDENSTFRTSWTNTSAYYSWGSNDGTWNMGLMENPGFEYGSGATPSGWTLYNWSVAERSQEKVDSGSWSLKLEDSLAVQFHDVTFNDHRFIFDGRVTLSGITGSARAFVHGFDAGGKIIYFKEFYNRTGTRNWESFQGVVENRSDIARLKIGIEAYGGGTAYFDNVVLRVIRPHNRWVAGGIAETCVSTGGRSMTYGTWYGQSLVADLIRDGVTGVKGYTWEPYLSAISHADILFPAYYQGYNLAESFWMGSEYGSWMGTVIGDPKCAPYINVRPDMGFNGTSPVSASVDDEGYPYISLSLFNKGSSPVKDGLVELYMDGVLIDSRRVGIDPGAGLVIEYTYSWIGSVIQGVHDLEVILNSDGAILEFDPTNNILISRIRVNTIPVISLISDRTEVIRTGSMMFNVTVLDPDGDMELGSIDLDLRDPAQERFDTVLIGTVHLGNVSIYRFEAVPPHDALTGYYTAKARYTDPHGSSASSSLEGGAVKVLNADPTLSCIFNTTEIGRGETFYLDLFWDDADTPDGDLTLNVTMIGSTQRRIYPEDFVRTSNVSGTFTMTIPPEHPSQTWTVTAKAIDRDGSSATWVSMLKTYNGIPSLTLITPPPFDVTRLDSIDISFLYLDPEGQAPEGLDIEVIGQGQDGNPLLLLSDAPGPMGGYQYGSTLNCRYLPVGVHSLVISSNDDENAPAEIRLEDAVRVRNIPATLFNASVASSSQAGSGDAILRGAHLTVTLEAVDPDDTGFGPRLTGTVTAQGFREHEFQLERRGGNIYTGRIITQIDWPVGAYSISIEALDDMSEVTTLMMEDSFHLDARMPDLVKAVFKIAQNGTFKASVELGVISGGSRAVEVHMDLIDEDGAVFGILLKEGSSNAIWELSGTANTRPLNTTLTIVDHLGRTRTYVDMVVIDVEAAPPPPTEGGGMSLALILIIAIIVLVAVAVAVALIALAIRRRSGMKPAPPADQAFQYPLQPPLPQGGSPALDGRGSAEALPMPSELKDGAIYHPPHRRSDPGSQTIPVMGEMVPIEAEPPLRGPGDAIEDIQPGQGIIKGDNIAPSDEHVPDSDDNDLPGDTGQSIEEISEGPGVRS